MVGEPGIVSTMRPVYVSIEFHAKEVLLVPTIELIAFLELLKRLVVYYCASILHDVAPFDDMLVGEKPADIC